jgi:hypothetical protein
VSASKKKVVVNDQMQRGYVYGHTEPVGRNFAPAFTPELTPKQMLRLGVFGGEMDTYLYLKYYADEDWRQQWLVDFPDDDMPARENPPHDRDRRLPQWDDEPPYEPPERTM